MGREGPDRSTAALGEAVGHLFRRARDAARGGAQEDLVALFDHAPGFTVRTGQSEAVGVLDGVRSAGTVEHQVVVRSGPVEIVLDVGRSPDGDGVEVRGQVLGADPGWAVQLLTGGNEVALATSDDLGEFTFVDVPAGRYELVAAGPREEIVADVELA